MSNGVPTFPADDISPAVRAHMDRADRCYKEHPGQAAPREWYEPPSAAERARASLASDPPPRTDEEMTRQVKEREREQARSLVSRRRAR